MAVRRHRLNPFKLLCLLIYGEYEFVEWNGQSVVVRNGPMARLLRVPNSRLREYLEWLAHWKYIENLDVSQYGVSTFRVTVPAKWEDMLSVESFGGDHE